MGKNKSIQAMPNLANPFPGLIVFKQTRGGTHKRPVGPVVTLVEPLRVKIKMCPLEFVATPTASPR